MKDDGNLDQDEQSAIRKWLKRKDWDKCPFSDLMRLSAPHDYSRAEWFCIRICGRMFPQILKLRDGAGGYPCPCMHYADSYVVRKARIVLARKGRLGRIKKTKAQKGECS